jgi:hypothetical protein
MVRQQDVEAVLLEVKNYWAERARKAEQENEEMREEIRKLRRELAEERNRI